MGSSIDFPSFSFQSHIRFSHQRAERFRHTTKLLMLRADALRQNKHCTERTRQSKQSHNNERFQAAGNNKYYLDFQCQLHAARGSTFEQKPHPRGQAPQYQHLTFAAYNSVLILHPYADTHASVEICFTLRRDLSLAFGGFCPIFLFLGRHGAEGLGVGVRTELQNFMPGLFLLSFPPFPFILSQYQQHQIA